MSVFSKGAECRRLKAGSVMKDQRKRGAEAPLYRTHSIPKLLRDHRGARAESVALPLCVGFPSGHETSSENVAEALPYTGRVGLQAAREEYRKVVPGPRSTCNRSTKAVPKLVSR